MVFGDRLFIHQEDMKQVFANLQQQQGVSWEFIISASNTQAVGPNMF